MLLFSWAERFEREWDLFLFEDAFISTFSTFIFLLQGGAGSVLAALMSEKPVTGNIVVR